MTPPGVATRRSGTIRALRAVAATAIAVLLFGFAWLLRFNDPDGSAAFLTDDHFFYLVRGWQILFGDLPVRDFVDHGAPLYYYVAAVVQMVFGRGTLSELVFSVTVLAGCAVGVFLLAMRASGSLWLGAGAGLFHVLLAPRFYNYPKILAYVLAIPALWAFADRQSFLRTALMAAVTVLAFLFRHDHGVFIAVSFAVLLVATTSLSWLQRLRHALVYGGLVVALLAPYLVFIQMNDGVVTYFSTAAAWARQDRNRAPVVWPGLFDNPDGASAESRQGNPIRRAVAVVQDNSVAWLFYGELALPAFALLGLAMSRSAFRPEWPHARAKVGAVIALAVVLDVGFLRSPLAARLADPSVPHAVLLAWLGAAALRMAVGRADVREPGRRGGWRMPVRAGAAAATAALLAVLFCGATDDLPRRLEKTVLDASLGDAVDRADVMWARIGASFPIAEDPAPNPDDLMTLSLYLRRCTQPTDRIFVQHYIPQVLGLAERGFAGGHADLRPGFFTTETMQRLTVARLKQQSVPVALVGASDDLGGFRDAFPIVVSYLDQQFQPMAEHTFNGRFSIRLLVNRQAHVTGRYQPLGWPCFRT
jgi:hypothetical protein